MKWLCEVHRKYKLRDETYHVIARIVDLYLTKKDINIDYIHIFAFTVLYIASKYEDIYYPNLEKYIKACSSGKFSKTEVLSFEREILETIDFNIFAPSMLRFLERYNILSNLEAEEK